MTTNNTTYEAFRTGFTYRDVERMLWVDSDNPDDWKRKSRGVVLFLLGKIKREMYEEAQRQAEAEAFEAEHGYPVEWDEVQADETTEAAPPNPPGR
jgi:hypothetical protein